MPSIVTGAKGVAASPEALPIPHRGLLSVLLSRVPACLPRVWVFAAHEVLWAVGMLCLDPREQGSGWFRAEEDVRVCVSQCFDQRLTAVT